MKTSIFVCSLTLALWVSVSHAQSSSASTPPAAAPAASKEMAEAEVRRVDRSAKKVTLKHGPIKSLDMPSMTMVFQVRDEKLFDLLQPGQRILFSAEQLQGAYVVTAVEKPAPK